MSISLHCRDIFLALICGFVHLCLGEIPWIKSGNINPYNLRKDDIINDQSLILFWWNSSTINSEGSTFASSLYAISYRFQPVPATIVREADHAIFIFSKYIFIHMFTYLEFILNAMVLVFNVSTNSTSYLDDNYRFQGQRPKSDPGSIITTFSTLELLGTLFYQISI